jgi:large subunit ribosomal protein L31
MKKDIHPKQSVTTFKCATCDSEYKLYSTANTSVVNIDVCSKCHPYYIGNADNQAIKGRAEKLSHKFSKFKENMLKKKSKK